MRSIRDAAPALAGLVLAACLAGCGGKNNAPKSEADSGKAQARPSERVGGKVQEGPIAQGKRQPSGRAPEAPASRPAPKRTLKPARDLKEPDGLASPVYEMKMARSMWYSYEDA